MGFTAAVTTCLRKYVGFSGRARRSEYWWFWLFNVLVSLAATAAGTRLGYGDRLTTLCYLFVLLPSLAAAVRRLHDTNRSGLWLLIVVVPLVGPILLLVWCCTDSDYGRNNFGDSPKYSTGFNAFTAGLPQQRYPTGGDPRFGSGAAPGRRTF